MTNQLPVQRFASLADARNALLAALDVWVAECIERYRDEPATDVHDQGTFMTSWLPAIEAGNGEALRFMTMQRDRIRGHFVATDQWRHGYWRMQEAHHGTEHFELFLAALWRANRGDGETIAQLVDMAEHLGNWSDAVPDWFNWDSGCFHSLYFGADGVRREPGSDINTPDHLRCVNLALLAHEMTGEARYVQLAAAHGGRWADAITSGEALPIALQGGEPIHALNEQQNEAYRTFAGQVAALDDDVSRVENILASNGVTSMLRLYAATEEGRYRDAARRLVSIIATQLGDPDAGPAADVVRSYRRQTGDTQFDDAVHAATAALRPQEIEALSFQPQVKRDGKPAGIGKRGDMPRWFEDGEPARCNPMTLAVAAEVGGDESLARCAIELALVRFRLARQVYPDGRDHGCSARSVSAIARGHGRDNDAGMITAVLGPLMDMTPTQAGV